MRGFLMVLGLTLVFINQNARAIEPLGNSSPEPGCVSVSEMERMDAVALLNVVQECTSENKLDLAEKAFHLSGVYAKYDMMRVSDQTAHQAYSILLSNMIQQMQNSNYDAFSELIKRLKTRITPEGAKQLTAELCVWTKRLTPPQNRPTYMINHGMGAFTGKTSFVSDPEQSQKIWKDLRQDYLGCQS